MKISIAATAFLILSARGQDPVAAYPKNYSVVLDNPAVSVIRVHYGPHEKLGVHDHSKNPTVYVYLNDSPPVRFEHFEEHGFALTRPPTAEGAFRVSPGRLEQHTVENMGDSNSDFLRVELKQIPLGRFKQAFRGPAPRSLSESRTSTEFKTPLFEVQRIICAGASACPVSASSDPSVIVAFTSLRIGLEKLDSGTVRWTTSSASSIAPDAGPAHLLRIVIPPPQK